MLYFYCESVTATSTSPWCIRPEGPRGKRTSGGIDTDSLCGRVTSKLGGWDMQIEPNLPLDVNDRMEPFCERCLDVARDRGLESSR